MLGWSILAVILDEFAHQRAVAAVLGPEHFQRDFALQRGVVGLVDHAHAAHAQQFQTLKHPAVGVGGQPEILRQFGIRAGGFRDGVLRIVFLMAVVHRQCRSYPGRTAARTLRMAAA